MSPSLSPSAAKVVVTGIGLWTGLGVDRESTWNAIRAGETAARALSDELSGPGRRDVGCPLLLEEGHTVGSDGRTLSIVARTAAEALADAGLTTSDQTQPGALTVASDRVATLIGLSKGCMQNLDRLARAGHDPAMIADGPSHSWIWEHLCWPNAGASLIAARYDLLGPCLAPVAACATGLVAVLQGAELIRRGVCDVALAGSADASLQPLLLGAFRRMGVLARSDGDPSRVARPWDRSRSGFIVGEGGAVLVLEREEHARARGILPYVEVAGGALGADAFHETTMNPDPAGLAALIGRALTHSGISASELDHINVHGTATRVNDPIECRAIRLALGHDANRVACSANKSQIGHLLGAAGAAELAITCLAMRDGFVPPTLNLDDPDPACDLDGTPHTGRSTPIRSALKLSIGFGGHLAAALLRQPDAPFRTPRKPPHG
ncbi:beta-ketoacyl-[acyl-carrier-protein] synthase family protein [Singulisphaera sp. Ch08]|uniref:Beta-ketoacyl-[acyl-carrier-protein] synthase family protein n=1 Tax=Singulisphaera sp. Ch08 TaxID=3120278 RepID=A0AAU7CS63_9BACT